MATKNNSVHLFNMDQLMIPVPGAAFAADGTTVESAFVPVSAIMKEMFASVSAQPTAATTYNIHIRVNGSRVGTVLVGPAVVIDTKLPMTFVASFAVVKGDVLDMEYEEVTGNNLVSTTISGAVVIGNRV